MPGASEQSLTEPPRPAGAPSDAVTDALRNAILAGVLRPGERLVEDSVMESLGATRAGTRKAFGRLEAEGLVISYPYRGVQVLAITAEEVQGILIPIRLILERFAFARAAAVMTSADLDRVDRHLETMARAARRGDVDAVVDCDIDLHEAVLTVVPDMHTLGIWRSIVPRLRVYFRRESVARPDLGSVVEEHRVLLEALRSGDADLLLETLDEHIKRVDQFGLGADSGADRTTAHHQTKGARS